MIDQEKIKKLRGMIPRMDRAVANANLWAEAVYTVLLPELKEPSVRDLYVSLFNEVQATHPELCRVVNYRRDHRSLGEYALAIYDNHCVEYHIFDSWFRKHGDKYFPGCSFKSYGVRGTGVLVFKEDRNEMKKPDFLVYDTATGSEVRKVELKPCPTLTKATYKKDNISGYVEYVAWLLTIHCDGSCKTPEDFDRRVCFYTLGDEFVQRRMLEELPVIDRREVGWKPGLQLYNGRPIVGAGRLQDYLTPVPW